MGETPDVIQNTFLDGLSIEQWRAKAHQLWVMLDDIDTLSDAMTPEQNAYYQAVMAIAVKRHEVLQSDGYVLNTTESEQTQ